MDELDPITEIWARKDWFVDRVKETNNRLHSSVMKVIKLDY